MILGFPGTFDIFGDLGVWVFGFGVWFLWACLGFVLGVSGCGIACVVLGVCLTVVGLPGLIGWFFVSGFVLFVFGGGFAVVICYLYCLHVALRG